MDFFHNVVLMPIITMITLFVLGLLFIVWCRFAKAKNPVPSRTPTTRRSRSPGPSPGADPGLHRGLLVPAALPAAGDPDAGPDHQCDRPSVVLELRVSGQRQLHLRCATSSARRSCSRASSTCSTPTTKSCCRSSTDIRIQVTGSDVIHAWTVPAFGVKHDAVPGRSTRPGSTSSARHLLRPVLGAVRRRARLHADQGARGRPRKSTRPG